MADGGISICTKHGEPEISVAAWRSSWGLLAPLSTLGTSRAARRSYIFWRARAVTYWTQYLCGIPATLSHKLPPTPATQIGQANLNRQQHGGACYAMPGVSEG